MSRKKCVLWVCIWIGRVRGWYVGSLSGAAGMCGVAVPWAWAPDPGGPVVKRPPRFLNGDVGAQGA